MSKKTLKKGEIKISKIADNIIVLVTAVMVFFTTLFIRLKVFNNYLDYKQKAVVKDAQNIFTYYKLIVLMILCFIILMIFLFKLISKNGLFRKDYVLICSGLIIAAAVLSTIMSKEKFVSLWGVFYTTNGLISYICLFTILYILSNIDLKNIHINIFMYTINLVSIIIVLLGVFELFGYNILNQYWFLKYYIPRDYLVRITDLNFIFNQTGKSAASLMANFDYMGAYCCIFLPLIAAFFVASKNLFFKVSYAIGCGMLFTGVIISGASTAQIATLFVLLLMPMVLLNKKSYVSIIILYSLFALSSIVLLIFTRCFQNQEFAGFVVSILKHVKYDFLIILCLVVYFVILYLRRFFVEKRYKVSRIAIISGISAGITGFTAFLIFAVRNYETIFSGRGYIWHHTWDLILRRFIIGYGPDTLYYNFPQFTPIVGAESVQLITRTHNIYLQYIYDIGIVGLLAFIAMIIIFLLSLTKSLDIEKDETKRGFIKGMIVLVIAYLIQGFANDNHLVYTPILFAILGLGMSASKIKLRDL